MKQIYYTQCPMGYGLGASNGFQIKRLDPGYPLAGDFRHFSMRAFVAGTRTPAPAALRYRRGEGEVAEVAWLTPRSHEYETERGLWGRPGGHFVHGLRLDEAELHSLADWPGGLFDRPLWTRSDPAPSRGQPPPPLTLTAADLVRPPSFAAVAPLAAGQDVERLARLLTALGAAAREGRTLFLIDEPERLAEWVALLTFAFPEPWRAALTFSTYHERPEELPGFRLQGTIPAARPNRPALLSLGFVADLAGGETGAIEPRVEPAGWARTLAGWLVRGGDSEQADWEATRRRAVRARARPEVLWSAEWLERFCGLPRLVRVPLAIPTDPRDFAELVSWTTWAARARVAEEWARAHSPQWWLAVARGPVPAEARAGLLKQLALPESWHEGAGGSAWGEVVAHALRSAGEAERIETTSAALATAPASERPAFAGALIRGLPPEAVASTLQYLESQPAWDQSILLPLKAPAAVSRTIEARDPRALQELLAAAIALPDALPAVLEAVGAEVRGRPRARGLVAEQLAAALGACAPRAFSEVHRWALIETDEPAAWLAPFWERLLADPLNLDTGRGRFQQLPQELRGPMTRLLLQVAGGSQVPPDVFGWAIEELVLPLAPAERPHDPAWPGAYLDHLPSGLDLLKRLYSKEYRKLGVLAWLEQARGQGELSAAQAGRLDDCQRYRRVLMAGDARALLDVKLPEVPAEERGTLLAQMLGRLADGSDDSLNLALDSCRAAWPAGFQAGALGLAGLAAAVTEPLLAERFEPSLWFERLERVLDRLELKGEAGQGYEPDSFAAEVVAATARWPGEGFDPWRLRRFLLAHDCGWRLLAADVRDDLRDAEVDARPTALERWDQELDKGTHTPRFFEVWLNACDPAQLTAAVSARAADLKNLDLPWWDSARYPGAPNDVRERFVRLAPLAPLRGDGTLARVRAWLFPARLTRRRGGAGDLVPLDDDPNPDPAERGPVPLGTLSEAGRVRWRCLEGLTVFVHPDETTDSRWERLKAWTKDLPVGLPLGQLEPIDRQRFLSWLLVGFPQLASERIARLAKWLFKNGFTDARCEWSNDWYEDLAQIAPLDASLALQRVRLVSELRGELRSVIRDAATR